LYHRINTHQVCLPPLRERRGDWLILAQHFLDQYRPVGKLRLSMAVRSVLADCAWPGNVRELQNVMAHCLSHSPAEYILPSHLPSTVLGSHRQEPDTDQLAELTFPAEWFGLKQKEAIDVIENEFNRRYLLRLLEAAGGNVRKASRRAGLDPKTFRSKWQKAALPPLTEREFE
jgi:two-component system response regulator HydG